MDMDTAVVNFSESESSDDYDEKLCNGPELSFDLNDSVLNTFVHDVENSLHDDCIHPKFELSNSLDIEKELNDLMGTLNGRRTPSFPNEHEEYDNVILDEDNGSNVNLGYEDTESDGESICSSLASDWTWQGYIAPNDYWKNQRLKSKSLIDKSKVGKLLKNGKQRMSMIEFGSKRKRTRSNIESSKDEKDDAVFLDTKQNRFLRLAYDRSSVVEPRVTSVVSLPGRPHSALADKFQSCSSLETEVPSAGGSENSSLSEQLERRQSLRISGVYDDNIDWAWLEDAVKDLNRKSEEPEQIRPTTSRVDAGCQTHSEQSWPGEEEGMRNTSLSEQVYDSTAIGVSSECRALEINGSCDEDMSGKRNVEGSGPSGVSSWLRQSMRRVRHFNLGDPPRIRSAPPDTLRLSVESVRSEGVVNPIVTNSERVQTQIENVQQNVRQQQRPRSAGNRPQRRYLVPRTRPVSAPARRPASGTSQRQVENGNNSQTANPDDSQDNLGYESDSTDRHPSPRVRRRRLADDENEDCEGRSPLGPWPHGLSSVLAGLGCTLGLFNISRFAILSVHFGSNFILQFIILSIILGVPLLAFHAALGQTLGAGPVDMWKISPVFQGIGIALLISQALIGIYSVVGVSWMFVYFRDSFITKQDSYRWAEPFQFYREDHLFPTVGPNGSYRLEQTVPEYLYGVVLQRNGLSPPENAFGHLKFQLTFNLAVVWMIVFVSLSKGLRSYGKVVYVFSLVPVLGILVLCSKLLGLTPIHRGLFPQTEWSEFFLNAKSWISAATEVMLTWNLLGAATMQVTSHNRATKRLWRDVITIALLTLVVLILSAFLANTCHQILFARGGYGYIPSSFERAHSYTFLRPLASSLPPSYTIPVRHLPHASLVAGDRVFKPGTIQESGYQVIRLATELVPATLALLGGDYLSPFWAVLFYFTLILFGVAQQLAIWHCVITGIMAINAPSLKSWETTITFFTCAAGFVLGLPMTTELGVFVVYFLDYCIGGGWWVLLLTLIEICAVLMVRGRPFSGENISIALFGKKTNCLSIWAVPMLTFCWNVIMPVALLVVCITIFKSGNYRDLWTWRCTGRDYWPLWAREIGVFIQIIPLLCFPIVALIQCYRYLSSGPPDLFDRIANLYRPSTGSNPNSSENPAQPTAIPPTTTTTSGTTELPPAEDPPPKYTPPPSYSTATGARIAKMLRQSFRRSMRRIQTVLGPEVHIPSRPPPPDYDSVLVEMNHGDNAAAESLPQSAESNHYTAADVAQLLRCSFRRVNGTNTSHSTTMNNQTSQNLVIPPQWNT